MRGPQCEGRFGEPPVRGPQSEGRFGEPQTGCNWRFLGSLRRSDLNIDHILTLVTKHSMYQYSKRGMAPFICLLPRNAYV